MKGSVTRAVEEAAYRTGGARRELAHVDSLMSAASASRQAGWPGIQR